MSKHTQSKKELSHNRDNHDTETTQTTSTVEDFKLLGRLGDGAYSQVYKVKRFEDGEVYALKKVKLGNLSDKEKENAINEVRILASINHRNVISYKEAFIEPTTQSLCIVMEYADNGDLFQKICEHQKDNTNFAEQDIWKIFIQIVRGLKSMHDLNIMHRDLKSANVFLNKDFTVKLGDMNVSKVANQRGLNYTQTGTPYYASPEVWRDEPYDIKSDVWSLGCVLYEMICLRPPFQATDMQGLYKRVIRGQYPRIPKSFSMELWQMVKSLLCIGAASRPDTKQIMNMSVFQNKCKELFPEEPEQNDNELLKTIKLPKNLMYLSNRLPNATYDKGSKINNSFKLNKSLHQKRNSGISLQGNGTTTTDDAAVRLPQLNGKSVVRRNEEGVGKVSSKANRLGSQKPGCEYGTDQNHIKYGSVHRQESLKKSNVSPISKGMKEQSQIQRMNSQDDLTQQDSVIIKESDFNDQTHPTEEGQPYEDKLSMPNLDINRSVIANSSDIPSIDSKKNQQKRDYSGSPDNNALKRESSLKKLLRDQSVESIRNSKVTGRSRVEQDNLKKLHDIYNVRHSNKLILYASGDKKVSSIEPGSRNYILVNKANDDIEPTQPIIRPIQLNLNLKGKHIPNKKSQQYIQNLNRIASVYSKGSLSPAHPIKRHQRDPSQGPYDHSNSQVSISISNVKLPKVDNRLMQISGQATDLLTPAKDYKLYENQQNKIYKKNKNTIVRNVSNNPHYPYAYQGKNYILMGKRTKEHNKSIIAESEPLKIGGSNIGKHDMTIIPKNDEFLI